MLRGQVEKNSTGKAAAFQPFLLHRLRGGFQNHIGASALYHLREQLIELPRIGGCITSWNGLRFPDSIADRTNQPRCSAHPTQGMMNQPSRRGFSVGSGHRNHLELFGGMAKKCRAQLSVSLSGILNHNLIGQSAILLGNNQLGSPFQRLRHIMVSIAQAAADADKHTAAFDLSGIAGHRGNRLFRQPIPRQDFCKKLTQCHKSTLL